VTEQNEQNADIFRLRREGIETKVVTEHRESEKAPHTSQALPPSNTKLFNLHTLKVIFVTFALKGVELPPGVTQLLD